MEMYGRMEVKLHSFLTSASDGGGCVCVCAPDAIAKTRIHCFFTEPNRDGRASSLDNELRSAACYILIAFKMFQIRTADRMIFFIDMQLPLSCGISKF
jgi:hypothetical protein